MKCSQLKSKANKTKSVDLIKYKKQRNLVVNFSKNFFFNWESLHARLNSHYEAWSYKKKKHKKIRAHRKSV